MALDELAAMLRFQAAAMRSQADQLVSQAQTFERLADDYDRGVGDVPARPLELKVVERDDDDEEGPAGGGERLVEDLRADGASREMRDWLDGFAPRIRGSEHFTAAVNAAADAGMFLSDETAQFVGAEVQMREEQGHG